VQSGRESWPLRWSASSLERLEEGVWIAAQEIEEWLTEETVVQDGATFLLALTAMA
jgi:hypothetical protein